MDFEILGDPSQIETIASGRGIRELPRLRRVYGKGRWRKMNCIGMKHTVSAGKSSNASASSTRTKRSGAVRRFAVCVNNDGYDVSLERNKIYVVIPDENAEKDGDLRVVDESGEDYLFSADRFVAIDVPAAVRASLLKAS